jgi:hypothetical protein
MTRFQGVQAYLFKSITGKTNWWETPDVNLEDAQAHMTDSGNPHGVTAAQVDTYTTTELDAALAGKSATGHTHNGLLGTGGTTGQVWRKNSSTNFDASWQDLPTASLPVGHIQDLGYEWISNTQYRVLTGQALVNGSLVTVASNVTRTPTLAANTLYYVYLTNAGAVEESTTAPVWDAALQYYKRGGGTPDANRRCLGFIQANATPQIRRFMVTVAGRQREHYYLSGEQLRVLNAGTTTASWSQVSLAEFVPAHAHSFWAQPKARLNSGGNVAILGTSPIDLGAGITASFGTYVVYNPTGVVGNNFPGFSWQPTGAGNSIYYRLENVTGTNEANIEVNGARFFA